MGDLTIPSGKGGRIKSVRVAIANIVEAKGNTGFIELKLGSHSGPFRFPISINQIASANTAGSGKGGTCVIDCDIEVYANETVKVYVTLAEAGVSGFAGIVWVSS